MSVRGVADGGDYFGVRLAPGLGVTVSLGLAFYCYLGREKSLSRG